MKLCVVGSYSPSLITFRGELLISAKSEGHEVVAFGPTSEESVSSWFQDNNIDFVQYSLARTGLNPFADLLSAWCLYKHYKRIKPDIVLSYTVKPVIWSTFAAHAAGVKVKYALITGLGNQFVYNNIKQQVVGSVIRILYRQALKRCDGVIFQNNDDCRQLIEANLVKANKTHVVNGSGVDLSTYQNTALPSGPPVFLTIARFLVAKGLREYAAAAREVKLTNAEARFLVVGFEEHGKNAIPLAELQSLHDEGVIELVGRVDNSIDALRECHIYVLASFYGEGLPRTILESMAIGRPVLTTDNVGCRDAVEDGYNGKLVEPRSSLALADGMRWFLENRAHWPEMARRSRLLAEQKYDVRKVNKEMFKIMGL